MLVLGEDLVIDYPIVDADAHVNEPPELWQERVPARLRERAPKLVPGPNGGDAWSFEGGKKVLPVAMTGNAGLSYLQFKPVGHNYAEMPRGGFEPAARLADMDLDGIHAQVIFPSVTLRGAKVYSDDPVMQVACVRAYNDWIADFCAHAPERLFGLGIIPTVGIEAAVTELDHCLKRGLRGGVISRFPNGSFEPTDADDRFWALCCEADLPVHVHIGSFQQETDQPLIPATAGPRFVGLIAAIISGRDVFTVVEDFLFSGIFDRFPSLKTVMVESNIGWIPTLLEQTDNVFLRNRFAFGSGTMTMLPSEYFYRNIWATFLIDTVGVANRHKCGLDHIMWSTDYPHATSDWPNSRVTLERNFRGVPYAEVKKIIQENAAKLYQIPLPG
jgi:predicted TIM-barrel fold metal-dependent hydrolase